MPNTLIRLTALSGTPLDETMVRQTVIAAAEALAERNGVALRQLVADGGSLSFVVDLERLEAFGFAAELRRSTDTWYSNKFRDGPLWGTPPPAGDASGADAGSDRDGGGEDESR